VYQLSCIAVKYVVQSVISWIGVAVMHCSRYMESRDGDVSVLLSSQQVAVACVRCIQKDSHFCEV
jgi:hypothetical protein